MENKSRPYTKEETVDIFLGNIHNIISRYEAVPSKEGNSRFFMGNYAALTVLSLIDPPKEHIQIDPKEEKEIQKQGLKKYEEKLELDREARSWVPRFCLRTQIDEDNIGAGLRNCLWETPDGLEKIRQEGRINRIQLEVLLQMKNLINGYSENLNVSLDELVADFLRIIDNGIGETQFEMEAKSTPEIIAIRQSAGKNYYPITGANIAGNLAARYKELYITRIDRTQRGERSIDD